MPAPAGDLAPPAGAFVFSPRETDRLLIRPDSGRMPAKTLLFFAKAPMNVLMFRPIVERLRDDPRFRLRFCGRAELGMPLRRIFAEGGLPDVRILPRWLARWRRADLYLSPDMTLLARRARLSVQLYHGVSFKGRMYTPGVLRYGKLFTIGRDMRRRYVERGLCRENDPRFESIGMPKTDRLVDGSLERETILRRAGLDPARKTVLYAPTWRPEASLYSLGLPLMRALPDLGVNLLVKLHDLSFDPRSNPIDWRSELPKLARPGFKAIEDMDIIPWLFASDALISDASSVANEFTLLDRPILFIDVPELFEKYKDTIDLGGWGRRTGQVVSTLAELKAALERALRNPQEAGDIRRAAARDIFDNPGRATAAAVSAIYRLSGLPCGGDPAAPTAI